MNKIFIINGSGRSGKSTFVSLCKKFDNSVVELSTIDFVKEVAKFAGWNGEKTEEGRKLLSDLKKVLESYHDIPNKKMDEYISSHNNEIIFINVREPKNIDYYVNKHNAKTILVTNSNVTPVMGNTSDANVLDYAYDYIIENNGTLEELEDAACLFMRCVSMF